MEIIKETAAEFDIDQLKANQPKRQMSKENTSQAGAAIKRMQEIAQGIYESTPGINDELPRHTSKILQNVKQDKKNLMSKSGGFPELTNEIKYEDWQTKYEEILVQYKQAKAQTADMLDSKIEKQERYIHREQEYKAVIQDIELKIKENSTRPLEIIEEKTEDQYLLDGIDIHDKELNKEIERKRQLQMKNASVLEGGAKAIKEIHSNHDGLLQQIDTTQDKMGKYLKVQRNNLWKDLDQKLAEFKEQFRKEAEKKNDNQYDYKEKEKELNEHLETMTQVAQNIDNDNRILTKKNQELKIQYLS